jgi:signal peptidase II
MILANIFLIVDRLTKILAVKGFFQLHKNNKIFFIEVDQKLVVVGVTFLLYILFSQLLISLRDNNKYTSLGYLLITLGGLSNIFDRIIYGYVIDMIPLISISVFNVADVMILFGCTLVFVQLLNKKK